VRYLLEVRQIDRNENFKDVFYDYTVTNCSKSWFLTIMDSLMQTL